MRKLIIVSIILMALLSFTGTVIAQTNKPDVSVISAKYIDSSSHVNIYITNLNPGNMIYLENYYSIDSRGKPKFYASQRLKTYVDSDKISFKLIRPANRRGQGYTFIEKIIINNDQRYKYEHYTDLRKYWN